VYALLPLSGSVPVLLGLAFVLGLGLGAAAPTTMSAIGQAAPPGRGGEAIGVRTMLVNASQTALPVLFGAMDAAAGAGAAFWTLAAILAGGCLFAARQRQR
jgi:MFS family permease